MVSVDHLQQVPYGLFKEPIIGPIKFKTAEIRHLENRQIAIKCMVNKDEYKSISTKNQPIISLKQQTPEKQQRCDKMK